MSKHNRTRTPNGPSKSTEEESETFHKGFGDFAVKSSDGVIFYVSRFLLAYTSPVFKDMFQLGPNGHETSTLNHADKRAEESPLRPLQLTETAETLDLLFRHVDPTLPNLPLDKQTIQPLLEAARKYQIPIIMSWFEVEAKKKVKVPKDGSYQSLISEDAMFVLSLASEYNLPTLCREAIHESIGKGPDRKGATHIPAQMIVRAWSLREQRIFSCLDAIFGVIDDVLFSQEIIPVQCDSCSLTLGNGQ